MQDNVFLGHMTKQVMITGIEITLINGQCTLGLGDISIY